MFVSILVQAMALVMFLLRASDGQYPSLDAEGLFPTSLAASPFLLSGFVGGIFISLLYLLLLWRRPDLERLLPDADSLDRITYKMLGVAFPLLTLMIAAGAYWANQTWGSYWSWDAKETWRPSPGWFMLVTCTSVSPAGGEDAAPRILRSSALLS